MKNIKYHTVAAFSKYSSKIEKTEAIIDTVNIHIRNRSLSWLGTGTSIKSDRVKLDLWEQTSPLNEMIRSCCNCFPHVSKMPTIYIYIYASLCVIRLSTIWVCLNGMV